MPKFNIEFTAARLGELLEIDSLPADCAFEPGDYVEFEVEIPQDEIDDEATEVDPERIETNPRDLRDGLRSLISGDFGMASLLLIRAFDGDEDAQRVVEEVLRAAARKKAA